LEDGENDGAVKLFTVKIRGNAITLLEFIITLCPCILQVNPIPNEQPTPLTPNSKGKDTAR
jgi:hypothetical protein